MYTSIRMFFQKVQWSAEVETVESLSMMRRRSGYLRPLQRSILQIALIVLLSLTLALRIIVGIGSAQQGDPVSPHQQATVNKREIPSLRSRGLCFAYDTVPHNYILHHSTFHPSPKKGTTVCKPDRLIKNVRNELDKSQNPPQCLASRQLVLDDKRGGLGGMINSWIKPFMLALDEKRQFWTPKLGYYVDKDQQRCNQTTMGCFVEGWSRCEIAPWSEKSGCRQVPERPDNVKSCISHLSLHNKTDRASLNKYSLLQQGISDKGHPLTVPGPFRHRGHFWYYNQLLWYLLRPNENFRNILQEAKMEAGFDNSLQRPLLSLHVRHGDSCSQLESNKKKRTCEDLSVYMDRAVLPLAKKYGIQSIYLATDDHKVIRDATENYPQFTWLYQPLTPLDRSPVQWDDIKKNNQVDPYLVAQQTLIDIFLLAEGDVYVGKFTSNVDRIAYSMLANRIGGLAPYVSLDSSWCFDWGERAGNSSLGSFQC